jgi:hypothetical protein
MNVQLKQQFQLPAAVYTDDQLMINNYNIELNMLTMDSNLVDLDIATARIDWFMYNELADAVFVDQADQERNSILAMLGLNMVTLPGPPVDQMIGIMLMCKLNAIAEGRIEVMATSVTSDLARGLCYTHSSSHNNGPFDQEGWWNDSNTVHNNIVLEDTTDNVVKVTVNPWLEHDLAWSSIADIKPESKIIVGNFSKKHDT